MNASQFAYRLSFIQLQDIHAENGSSFMFSFVLHCRIANVCVSYEVKHFYEIDHNTTTWGTERSGTVAVVIFPSISKLIWKPNTERHLEKRKLVLCESIKALRRQQMKNIGSKAERHPSTRTNPEYL